MMWALTFICQCQPPPSRAAGSLPASSHARILSLSRAPAIPANRRKGESSSRRINAARRFTRVPFRQKVIHIFVFPTR